MKHKLALLAWTHLAAFGFGYQVAPREMLDTEVSQSGFFQRDTMEILSATVSSLRSENKLLVYSYKGDTRVSVSRSKFWLFQGHQDLMVPASVIYFVDMANLASDAVAYDPEAKLVTVNLPPLKLGDIAFQPEEARAINGGLLTWSQEQVDELTKLNYASARKAFVKSAQDPTLVGIAKRQAIGNVTNYFQVPLHVAGHSDVRVAVKFAPLT
jgi:hypothetical protein